MPQTSDKGQDFSCISLSTCTILISTDTEARYAFLVYISCISVSLKFNADRTLEQYSNWGTRKDIYVPMSLTLMQVMAEKCENYYLVECHVYHYSQYKLELINTRAYSGFIWPANECRLYPFPPATKARWYWLLWSSVKGVLRVLGIVRSCLLELTTICLIKKDVGIKQ